MSFSGFIYDISLLGAIMITGAVLSTAAYNVFEIIYWKYVDWKLGKKDESR
tara:strand:+ start:276 stop:428 length:153 start_codon:yes stop_codon:yes gene_type:complete